MAWASSTAAHSRLQPSSQGANQVSPRSTSTSWPAFGLELAPRLGARRRADAV